MKYQVNMFYSFQVEAESREQANEKAKKVMKIIIKILDDNDDIVASKESLDFESAEENLGKLERFMERKKEEDKNFIEDNSQ